MNNERVEYLFKMGRVEEARVFAQQEKMTLSEVDLELSNFKKQNEYGPHRAFDKAGSDWSHYFLYHDGLHNLEDDIVFSIFEKYLCRANCKTCYLKDQWMTDEEFRPFSDIDITKADEDYFLDVFKYFYRVGSIDDLSLIKKIHPQAFSFYKRYAHLMEHNITDNSFFSQYDIMMNECHFDKIAYLSFSDYIIDRQDGEIVKKIIPMLEKLNDRSPIRKMNFIMSKGYPTENKNIMELFDWVINKTSIETFFHTDLCKKNDHVADLKAAYGYDLPSIYYQENEVYPPIICQLLTETIQMRGRSVYSTLVGSSLNEGDHRITTPFYHAKSSFELSDFLAGVIRGKVKTYEYYRDSIRKKNNNRYYDYFNWCANSIKINDDYTFIPAPLLSPHSVMAKKLPNYEFNNSYAGWIKKTAKTVTPIVGVVQ